MGTVSQKSPSILAGVVVEDQPSKLLAQCLHALDNTLGAKQSDEFVQVGLVQFGQFSRSSTAPESLRVIRELAL